MTPEAQAIIDNANALDAALAAAMNQHADDSQALAKMQAQLSTAAANSNAMQTQLDAARAAAQPNITALLPTGAPITAITGMHLLPYDTDPNARNLLRWFQPGPTGNSNPKATDPHGTWSITDANGVRTVSISPAGPYNNYFFAVNVVKGDTQATRYAQLVRFEVPDAAVPNCQAIETNWEHSLGGLRFNQGTQLFFNGGSVRYYDITAGAWKVLTGVPLPPIGTGKPVTIINEVQRLPVGMTFIAVWINGVRYQVNITTKPLASPWASYLQGAPVQLDVTGSGKGYSILLRDAQVAWI